MPSVADMLKNRPTGNTALRDARGGGSASPSGYQAQNPRLQQQMAVARARRAGGGGGAAAPGGGGPGTWGQRPGFQPRGLLPFQRRMAQQGKGPAWAQEYLRQEEAAQAAQATQAPQPGRAAAPAPSTVQVVIDPRAAWRAARQASRWLTPAAPAPAPAPAPVPEPAPAPAPMPVVQATSPEVLAQTRAKLGAAYGADARATSLVMPGGMRVNLQPGPVVVPDFTTAAMTAVKEHPLKVAAAVAGLFAVGVVLAEPVKGGVARLYGRGR